jgi:uncharacterized protein (TIGR02284 family)
MRHAFRFESFLNPRAATGHLSLESCDQNRMSTEMADEEMDVIKKLIETCRDAQAGYLEAAEHVRSSALRAFFSRQSIERAKFAAELESVARRRGETEPDQSPSIANKIHRAWIDLKTKFGGGDASVIESVEFEERSAKDHYLEALSVGLPLDLQTVLERQAESVVGAYEQVCTLRKVYRQAA